MTLLCFPCFSRPVRHAAFVSAGVEPYRETLLGLADSLVGVP